MSIKIHILIACLCGLAFSTANAGSLTKIGNDPTFDGIVISGLKMNNAVTTGEIMHNSYPHINNPVINAHNLYAPDTLLWSGKWRMYYGGFLTSSHTRDEIYYSETSGDDPTGALFTPVKVINVGTYRHVNDPSVIWAPQPWPIYFAFLMYYTVAQDDLIYIDSDWIHLSLSLGSFTTYHPSTPNTSNRITFSDPNSVLPSAIERCARPGVLLKDGEIYMWFDAHLQSAPNTITTILAKATTSQPKAFTIVHQFGYEAPGLPTLLEPDVTYKDGLFKAVWRTNWEIWYAESTDGINWTDKKLVVSSAWQGFSGWNGLHNPCFYEHDSEGIMGIAYGMSANTPFNAKVGSSFFFNKPILWSPGPVGHFHGNTLTEDEMYLRTYGYSSFTHLNIWDPVTFQLLSQHDMSQAQIGDIYRYDQ